MSHDCCKKCGELEPVPYRSIRKVCELPDCPQKIVLEQMRKITATMPKRPPFLIKEDNK